MSLTFAHRFHPTSTKTSNLTAVAFNDYRRRSDCGEKSQSVGVMAHYNKRHVVHWPIHEQLSKIARYNIYVPSLYHLYHCLHDYSLLSI